VTLNRVSCATPVSASEEGEAKSWGVKMRSGLTFGLPEAGGRGLCSNTCWFQQKQYEPRSTSCVFTYDLKSKSCSRRSPPLLPDEKSSSSFVTIELFMVHGSLHGHASDSLQRPLPIGSGFHSFFLALDSVPFLLHVALYPVSTRCPDFVHFLKVGLNPEAHQIVCGAFSPTLFLSMPSRGSDLSPPPPFLQARP
jgi:hypothetical protein